MRAFGAIRGPYMLGRLTFARSGFVSLRVPGLGVPVLLRARTSDKPTFEQVFVSREYELPPLRTKPRLIIDGGANAGFTTRFFACEYPDAQIVAVEPELTNFEVLRQNTRHLPNVIAVRAALWNYDTQLGIANPDADKWAFQVQETRPGLARDAVKSVTLSQIMAQAKCDHIDILKLDIEGAEQEVFASGYESWLVRTNVIIIELHERLRPGSSSNVYRAIKGYGFSLSHRGEHAILTRQAR